MNSPQDLAQCILLASNQSVHSQQAASMLDELRHSSPDGGVRLCIQLIQTQTRDSENHNRVIFFALSTIQYSLQTNRRQLAESILKDSSSPPWRLDLRAVLFHYVHDGAHWIPKYLRTKIGLVFALLIQLDFPHRWPTAFDDLIHQLAEAGQHPCAVQCFKHDIFLLSIQAFCDEVVDDSSWSHNTFIKDLMRNIGGIYHSHSEPTVVSKVLQAIWNISQLYKPLVYNTPLDMGKSKEEDIHVMMQQIPVLALQVFNRFIPWVDIALITHPQIDLSMQDILSKTGPADMNTTNDSSPSSQCAVQALLYYTELIRRGMEENKKLQLLLDLNILDVLNKSSINMDKVDVTHITVVIKAAELVNLVGLEFIPRWEQCREGKIEPIKNHQLFMSNLLFLFYKLFAYDDIDVSSAVTPLASRIITSIDKELKSSTLVASGLSCNWNRLSEEIQPILTILYTQMRYPATFQFDFENEDEAEEEVYRSELRRLYISICRLHPTLTLEFVATTFYSLPSPLSSAPTSNLEAALRLVYHYCEGLRPAPGVSLALKSETFQKLLLSLHNSDVAMHSHREILILYYDIAVRYCSLFQRDCTASALPNVLSAMTGTAGLQHAHPRVRSRSCYLLLKLVQAMGKGMNQYTEAVVVGIQGFVMCSDKLPIEDDDILYLFETVGLLLGNSDLHDTRKKSLLTAVIQPHAISIEQHLAAPNLKRDPEYYGKLLSNSVAAIAYLSKGFTHPENEIQQVLAQTLPLCLCVLTALSTNGLVRNKILIYLQRMIYCLGRDALNSLPPFTTILIEHADTDDISDIGQLLTQISTKFKQDARLVMDSSLLSFIRKCEMLTPKMNDVADNIDGVPPHHVTEQLLIKKLMFVLISNVVSNNLTDILLSPTNAPCLEDLLNIMCDGALLVEHGTIQKHCVHFFRALVQQWAPDGSRPIEDATYRFGFLTFVYHRLVPALMDMVLGPRFHELDASDSRILRDIGFLLYDLSMSRGLEEFTSMVISVLSMKMQLNPLDLVGSMDLVVSPEGMSTIFGQWVSRAKHKNE